MSYDTAAEDAAKFLTYPGGELAAVLIPSVLCVCATDGAPAGDLSTPCEDPAEDFREADFRPPDVDVRSVFLPRSDGIIVLSVLTTRKDTGSSKPAK